MPFEEILNISGSNFSVDENIQICGQNLSAVFEKTQYRKDLTVKKGPESFHMSAIKQTAMNFHEGVRRCMQFIPFAALGKDLASLSSVEQCPASNMDITRIEMKTMPGQEGIVG